MTFCSTHSKDLDAAFASLSLSDTASASSDPTKNPPVRPHGPTQTTQPSSSPLLQSKYASPPIPSQATTPLPAPSDELSTILTSLRKLREGLLASSSSTSLLFSQRVHIFNIRMAILARHPPSYHPSLLHLLSTLHSDTHPLPRSELFEMTTYLVLDLALRQSDLIAAYAVKHTAKRKYNYLNRDVDSLLQSITTNNWVVFWRVRRRVDGYVRALMHWYIDAMRKTVLKAFGRSYLKTDLEWVMASATSGLMSWEELVEKERIGWLRDGDVVVIRKPKVKS